MAKKKRKDLPAEEQEKDTKVQSPEKSFEIGQKGDDFDLSYTRAVKNATADTDKLLTDLSSKSGADKYNFVGFAVPALIIMFFALSFLLIGRSSSDDEIQPVKLSVANVLNGSYTEYLDSSYNTSLPFESSLKALGSYFGLCDAEAENAPNEDISPVEEAPEEPVEPTEPVQTEPAVTSAATSEVTTVTEVTETVSTEEPDTVTMYAAGTLYIRLGPSEDEAILGYFTLNNKVQVIEIRSDGWAEIYYSGIIAYVDADLLSRNRVVVTTVTEETEPEITTEEVTTEQTTVTEDTTEPTTEATTESETEATTTTRQIYSYYTEPVTSPVTTTTPEVTTEPTTVSTTEPTTVSTTEPTTEPTTVSTTEPTTVTEPSTEPSSETPEPVISSDEGGEP